MVNFYQLLGVGVNAPAETIATIIKLKRLQNQMPVEVLDKAEVWLLNTDMRARYDAKLRQKHPDVFAQSAVMPRQTPPKPVYQIEHSNTKRRKVGRWYLLGLIGLVALVWWLLTSPLLGIAKPESWQAIGLERLETSAQWHQTDQAIYLTQQHEQPHWLWVWQQAAGLSLMPIDNKTPVLCEGQATCKIAIAFDHEPAQHYVLKPTNHAWGLQSPADEVALSLRLQHAKHMEITWSGQEKPVVFQAAAFPTGFLLEGSSSPF